MAAGSRRALGEIGNQIGGGLTTRNGAKEQAVKCVDSPVHFPVPVSSPKQFRPLVFRESARAC
jgi:hypothetical protein